VSKTELTSAKILEEKFRVFSEQSGRCFSCGLPMSITEMELAHRIPQRSWTIKLFGSAVIHHRKNLRGTHPGRCNSKAQLNPDSIYAEDLAREIQRHLRKEEERQWRR